MNIKALAQQAGLCYTLGNYNDWIDAGPAGQELKDFAKLVAEHEREECAKIAKKTVCDTHIPKGIKICGAVAANAIRARSKA